MELVLKDNLEVRIKILSEQDIVGSRCHIISKKLFPVLCKNVCGLNCVICDSYIDSDEYRMIKERHNYYSFAFLDVNDNNIKLLKLVNTKGAKQIRNAIIKYRHLIDKSIFSLIFVSGNYYLKPTNKILYSKRNIGEDFFADNLSFESDYKIVSKLNDLGYDIISNNENHRKRYFMNKNDYININDFIKALKEHIENGTGKLNKELSFLNNYKWINDDVISDIVSISKQIKANNKRFGLENSNKKIGRPRQTETIKRAVYMYKQKVRPIQKILDATGIGRSTLYENIKKYYDEV